MIQYRFGYIPMDQALDLEQFTVGKIWMIFDLCQRMARALTS
jgi:hypothetical protein